MSSRAKWRFNRALRSLVASPRGVDVANIGARVVPGLVRRIIATAGDCGTVSSPGSRVWGLGLEASDWG